MFRHIRLLALFVALVAGAARAAAWQQGRATFYGDEPWWWSIHHGSCGKGYLWPDQGTGWDVAALSDRHPEYRGSCGVCYEVKCSGGGMKDGYGAYIDRNSACRDPEASVVVSVTDTCPCVYSSNYYSNKRWCCGDMNHMDLSVWAFSKLSEKRWGVIPITYRRVDCSYKPAKQAGGSGGIPGELPPKSMAGQRDAAFYKQYFSGGGYLNSHAGDGSKLVSVDEFLRMAGGGGSGSGSAQYGK